MMAAAGILPAVEPGVPPGGKTHPGPGRLNDLRARLEPGRWTRRQDAASYGRRDVRRRQGYGGQARRYKTAGPSPLYFTLFVTNHGGAPFTPTVTNPATAVTNGLFNTTIDFGPGIFTGGSNWLELAVQTNGGSCFTTLAPRQLLTPVPYAITAAGLSGYLPFPPSSSPTARAA